jgi:hypothetical protein
MNESQPEITSTSLETGHRNLLQIEIMRRMSTTGIDDATALAWIGENAKTISDIVDAPEHEEVRRLARERRYDEAADRIMELIN